MVGFDGVIALILQRIGADLIQQADVTSFLTMVEQNTASFFSDMRKRRFQLKATITTQTEQRIAGQTFGMNTCQDRRLA